MSWCPRYALGVLYSGLGCLGALGVLYSGLGCLGALGVPDVLRCKMS